MKDSKDPAGEEGRAHWLDFSPGRFDTEAKDVHLCLFLPEREDMPNLFAGSDQEDPAER